MITSTISSVVWRDSTCACKARLKHHERELAARRQYQRHAPARSLAKPPEGARNGPQQDALDRHQQHRQSGYQPRTDYQQVQVGGHAHADEEQAQQQALEGLEVRFQFVPVFRVGQQHAGQECAQCHGNARLLHQPARAQHHQQRGRDGYLQGAGPGNHAEEGPQQIASAHHHQGDHQQHAPERGQHLQATAGSDCLVEQGDHGNQRDCGNVLEQQDGKGKSPRRRLQLLALGQDLQAEGSRRQGQRQAEHHRAAKFQGKAEPGNGGNHQARGGHLYQAHAEHVPAHHPQAPGRQLQPDDEQQQHHAQLGHVRNGLGIARQTQAAGPDGHARHQIAQHRAQLQPLCDRHHQHRRQQEYQRSLQHRPGSRRTRKGNIDYGTRRSVRIEESSSCPSNRRYSAARGGSLKGAACSQAKQCLR